MSNELEQMFGQPAATVRPVHVAVRLAGRSGRYFSADHGHRRLTACQASI